ncbi:MAG: gamma-glutamyl-gamma-aminobutyrate hydrolase family protein [Actinobacteria bacterium]|nr:gamma-glutamyl-gamma-aminobutyrate hydrolase family protein [Actinomycetota bacterium]
MKRPPIAIAGRGAAAGRVSRSAISFAGRVYLDAVLRAGGEPLTLSPRELRHDEALQLLKGFRALVLMGGADVDPHLYGQQRHPQVYGVNAEQDHFEMALIHAANEMRLPTLAVCRGIQLVNVALGGTLIQHIGDVPGAVQHAPGKFPAGQEYVLHDVDISPRTRLSKAVGATKVNVASFHHQGIDVVGKGLKVVARSADGLVEGLEHTGRDRWLIGVQWHPEDTAATDPYQQNLYDALISVAR